MKLLDIPFDERRRRYLIFSPEGLNGQLALASTTTTREFENISTSRFYLARDHHILAKVMPDKFLKQRNPIQWLCRDYLEKRCLAQLDARKEYIALGHLQAAGLRTPKRHGWGLSLNPGNRNGSILLLEHVIGARRSGDVFDNLDEKSRKEMLDTLAIQVTQLAQHGYAHRDLHLNNFLTDDDGSLIWIDAHLSKLPREKSLQWKAIQKTLTAYKLHGEKYRAHMEKSLHKLLLPD